jgi:hypothetical protein
MKTEMKILLSLLLATVVVYPAAARLGETKDEIYKRYGTVQKRTEISTNEWTGKYQFKEYIVLVFFKDNISVGEALQPIEKRDFSDEELKALRAAIGGEGEWKEKRGASLTSTIWINEKNGVVACHKESVTDSGALVVARSEFLEKYAEVTEKEEKSKADGF